MLVELGGWPVLEENWDDEKFSWQETVYALRDNHIFRHFVILRK